MRYEQFKEVSKLSKELELVRKDLRLVRPGGPDSYAFRELCVGVSAHLETLYNRDVVSSLEDYLRHREAGLRKRMTALGVVFPPPHTGEPGNE